MRADTGFARHRRAAGDLESTARILLAHGQVGYRSCLGNARQRSGALDQLGPVGASLADLFVAVAAEADAHSQRVIGIVAERPIEQREEALAQQSRSDGQDNGQRDLGGDDSTEQSAAAERRTKTGGCHAKRLDGGSQTGNKARQSGH